MGGEVLQYKKERQAACCCLSVQLFTQFQFAKDCAVPFNVFFF